ncbi:unnamed protein product [Lampetra planeri]
MDEAELERLAREEILQEANRGRVRAETMGTMGWQKCPLPATNKRFLVNTLRGALMPPRSRVASSSRDHASREDTSSPPSKSPVQGHKVESHDDGAKEKHSKEKTRRRYGFKPYQKPGETHHSGSMKEKMYEHNGTDKVMQTSKGEFRKER